MHEPILRRPPVYSPTGNTKIDPYPPNIVVPPPSPKSEPPNWEIPFTISDPTVPDVRKPEGAEPHYHRGQDGLFYRCYHHCRNSLTSVSFWIGMTLGFPLEHLLWERVPGFAWITHLLGL